MYITTCVQYKKNFFRDAYNTNYIPTKAKEPQTKWNTNKKTRYFQAQFMCPLLFSWCCLFISTTN